MPMIELTIHRPGGTKIPFGDPRKPRSEYFFQPNERGHHVCFVVDTDDAAKLLKCDGFVLYPPDLKWEPPKAESKPDPKAEREAVEAKAKAQGEAKAKADPVKPEPDPAKEAEPEARK